MTQTNGKAFRYEQIADSIQRDIESGKWRKGDRLPPIRDLAQEYGCNYHTIRSALNLLLERGMIESRRGSGTYVKSLGVPVPMAARTTGAENIGVIIEPGQNGYFSSLLLHAVHQEAERHGRSLVVRTIVDYKPETAVLLEEFEAFNCGSIIIPHLSPWHDYQVLRELIHGSTIPVVISDFITELERNCCWDSSLLANQDSMHVSASCRYFQALGYEHIAILGRSRDDGVVYEGRLMEYSRFINENGLQSHIGLVRWNDENKCREDYSRLVAQWSKLKGKLAVVCYTDEIAIRLLIAMQCNGVSVPQDIAILGCNDLYQSAFTDPPLSTVKFPYDYTARALVTHALALSRGETAQTSDKHKPEFVIRGSCGGKLRAGDKLDQILAAIAE